VFPFQNEEFPMPAYPETPGGKDGVDRLGVKCQNAREMDPGAAEQAAFQPLREGPANVFDLGEFRHRLVVCC